MKYSSVFIFVIIIAFINCIVSKSDIKMFQIGYRIIMVISAIVIVLYVRYANICYLKCELNFNQALCYFTELKTRMESCQGYYLGIPVCYINEYNKIEPQNNTLEQFPEVTIPPYVMSFINDYAWKEFMHSWIGFNPVIGEFNDDFWINNDVSSMPRYPDDGSIIVNDGVLIVNF